MAERMFPWLEFPGSTTRLLLVALPPQEGQRRFGFVMDVGERPPEGIAEAARAEGFGAIGSRKTRFRLLLGAGERVDRTLRRLQQLPGAVPVAIPLEEMRSSKWLLDLREAPGARPAPRRVPDGAQPDRENLEELGRNHHGDLVVRDADGRYYRMSGEGAPIFVAEKETDPGPVFLRMHDERDIPGLAAGLMKEMELGENAHLSASRLDQRAAVAVDPAGRRVPVPNMGPEELSGRLAAELHRRIVLGIAAEGDPSSRRAQLHEGLKLAEKAARAITARLPEDGDSLAGAPQLTVLLRHALGSAERLEVTGSRRLADALAGLEGGGERDNPDAQVIDLSATGGDDLVGRVMGAMARRAPRGVSAVLVPGRADGAVAEALRQEVGRYYGVEAVGEISPGLASGDPEKPPVTLLVFGEQRPEAAPFLPDAGLRSYKAEGLDGLEALAVEIQRARGRLREWFAGEEAEAAGRDHEGTESYVAYRSMSKATEAFAMLPRSLEGAVSHAQERVSRHFAEEGGVDNAVAGALGLTYEALVNRLTAEQVDAVAMRMEAGARGRSYLLADATGIGKGRTLQAMAREHMRKGGRVLMVTESPEINIPDVFRDLGAVGLPAGKQAAVMATSAPFEWDNLDEAGERERRDMVAMSPVARRQLIEAGWEDGNPWPEGVDYLATTYSMLSRRMELPGGAANPDTLEVPEELRDRNRRRRREVGVADLTPPVVWAQRVARRCREDGRPLMVIFDEGHNALNPRSATGMAARGLILNADDVVFASGTPFRDARGLDLYESVLPRELSAEERYRVLETAMEGGEAAQESMTTMLTQDGVMLRREHDLSQLEFHTDVPPDEEIARAEAVMAEVGALVEDMLEAYARLKDPRGRVYAHFGGAARARGVDVEEIRTRWANNLMGVGSPIAALNNAALNALKAPMVVRNALRELEEGRKPLIAFQSTNEAVLRGAFEGDGAGDGLPLNFALTAARINERIYMIRGYGGEQIDARDVDPELQEISDRIRERVAQLPEDLPVSPVDAIRDGIEAAGRTFGEISGRSLHVVDGRIAPRRAGAKRDIVAAFNNGELDVMAFNSAGATGASYHASPEFRDQRRRSFIEFEAPPDIIKYVQSLGRGNRYGQMYPPRMVSIVAGLAPELRLYQQRNRKLRRMGASVDANRAHPYLARDVPDLLNRVGDMATLRVLAMEPERARRLGVDEFIEETNQGWDIRNGAVEKALQQNLTNRVLTRLVVLHPEEQRDMMARIETEFEASVAELDSRNMNPLTIRTMPGRFEVKAARVYEGDEPEEGSLDASALTEPVWLETGIQHLDRDALPVARVLEMVERAGVEMPTGFSAHADRLEQIMPALLADRTPGDVQAALRDVENQPPGFVFMHRRYTQMVALMRQLRPGVELRFMDGPATGVQGIVTRVQPPPRSTDSMISSPSSYVFDLLEPGMEKPAKYTLGTLLRGHFVRVEPGFADGPSESARRTFEREADRRRQWPQQFLTGNILQAIRLARTHRLGEVVAATGEDGRVRRGVMVERSKVDLKALPVLVADGDIAAGAALVSGMRGTGRRWTIWEGPKRAESQISVHVVPRERKVVLMAPPRNRKLSKWWERHEGLHELLFNGPFEPRRNSRTEGVELQLGPENAGKFRRIFDILAKHDLHADADGGEDINAARSVVRQVRREGRSWQAADFAERAGGMQPAREAPAEMEEERQPAAPGRREREVELPDDLAEALNVA